MGVIEANGTIRGTTSASVAVRPLGTGQKQVDLGGFSTTNCAYVVTTTDGNGGLTGTAEGDEPGEVIVYTYNFQGNVVNLPFSVVMVC